MQKTLLVALLGLFGWCSAGAQQQIVEFNPNDTTYVFGDKINVRSAPGTDAAVAAQLSAGSEVVILERREEKTTLNGVELAWYKVQFNGNQTGFVWGGLLSAWGKKRDGDVQFVANVLKGVKKSPEDLTEYTFEVRAIRGNTILSRQSISIATEGSVWNRYPVEPGARGLKGYKTLVQFGVGFEACGYPWYNWYLLWNGTQLVPLPLCESIADGGVFAHVESYLFPQPGPDNGFGQSDPGHYQGDSAVYFCIEHTETEEKEEGKGGWDENSWKRVRPLRWDGKQWIRPKNMGEPKN